MNLVLKAPAKINLSLRVLRRREDGFHEIESLIAPIDLCDELHLSEATSTVFTCSDDSLPTDSSNLVIRALESLSAEVGRPLPLRIHLEKRIPHGAGLGGGSSDAAALLSGANSIYGLRLSSEKLSEIAASLGSDIPFFIEGFPAWCRGRGELIEPLGTPLPTGIRVLLAKPEFGVSTPWAYQHWMASRALPGVSYDAVTVEWGEVVNDLERPVFQKYPVLADMKGWLSEREEVAVAGMSGSGATMLAFLRDEVDRAREATLQEALREEFGEGLWVRSARVQAASAGSSFPAGETFQ